MLLFVLWFGLLYIEKLEFYPLHNYGLDLLSSEFSMGEAKG